MRKYLITIILIFSLSKLHSLPWLRCQGTKVVDESGKEVILQGVNIGGWLAEELWMLPIRSQPPKRSAFEEIHDAHGLWTTLSKRFGAERMHKLRQAFREKWFTEQDLASIQKLGFNCVRVPFIYDLAEEPSGLFYWLDYVIDAASRHNLYVILDMHGTPGRQSNEQHTGQKDAGELFTHFAHVKRTSALWKEIATRYKDNPTVCAFDLMNEPMGAPSNKALYNVYDKLYRSIRKIDKKHILIIQDGYKGVKRMAKNSKSDWKNVILSSHTYNFKAKTENDFLHHLRVVLGKVKNHLFGKKMPYFLGEFNVAPDGSQETLAKYVDILKRKKISFAFWTYKVHHQNGCSPLWGLYYTSKKMPVVDPFTDSERDILKKIEKCKTDYFIEHHEVHGAFANLSATR